MKLEQLRKIIRQQIKKDLNQTKIRTGSDIVKIFRRDREDWGDMIDRVHTKGNNFVVVDTFFYGSGKAMKDLINDWSPGGTYYDYFLNEYGVKLQIVDSFLQMTARGRYKKLTGSGNLGIVGVELKIV